MDILCEEELLSMSANIPNLLSVVRIVSAPFLLLSGWFGMQNIFYILFGIMLLSDVLDGMIARGLHQTTQLGAKLDSVGDIITYFSIALAAWWLWPDLLKKEIYYMIAAITMYTLPALFALVKFGRLASYHTWTTKLTAVVLNVGVVILLLFENTLLFHIAVYCLFIAMLENILITLVLPSQQSDVHSLWHVWKNRDQFYQ